MLQKFREKFHGGFAIAMLLFIAVPLVLSFVGSRQSATAGFAARVNGEEISNVDFKRVYQNRLMEEQQAAKGQLPPEAESVIRKQTLDGLVMNRAVTQFVRDTGLRVDSGRVVDYLRKMPVFQVGGQFSKASYDAILASQGISPAAFEKEQQSLLAVQQLQQGLIESAFYTPAELRRLIQVDLERRNVAYVLFDPAQLGAAIQISDTDVQSYYVANTAQFQTPESVDLDYIELSLADMARGYEPDEDSLRKAYEADPTRFRTAEERHARHILVTVDAQRDDAAAKQLADEIAAKLAAGGDFAALAAQYSGDSGSASRGGDLGFAARDTYVKPFEEALFALKPGETSPPVKTEFGYHIIRLEEVRPGTEQSFEDVRAQLADELRRRKAQDEFYALAERIDDLSLENPNSLEPVAKDTGLAIHHLADYTRNGGGPFGDNANLLAAVFSPGVLDGGENTPLVELDESRVVVARVAEHRKPTARPLEEVRGEIIDRLRRLRAATEAGKRGEQLLDAQRKTGADLGQLAAAEGIKVTDAGLVTRRSPAVPQDLLAAVFRAPKPADGKTVVQGVALENGGYAVFRLSEVLPGQPESVPPGQLDQQKQRLAQRSGAGETDALAQQLRDSAKVVVAPDLLKGREEEPQ